jgi:predicted extracellular nuclease/endonuclease I/DNA/RNA endonuclease YhcR with UshA esterase domain
VISEIDSTSSFYTDVTINDGSGDVDVRIQVATGFDFSSIAVADTLTAAGGVTYASGVGQVEPNAADISVTNPAVPPALEFSAAPSAGSLTDSLAVISFSANYASVAAIYYGESSYTDTVNAASATDFSETLANLAAETAYIAQVRITKDGDTENVLSDTLKFTTAAALAPFTGGLYFSEYVEGGSSNKALEIYNGTGSDFDLSRVKIEKDVNGNDAFGSTLTLSGTLNSESVYVIANSSADSIVQAVADLTNGGALNYNGDDQVRLYVDDVVVDHIGVSGDISYGQDVTLRRKSSVTTGNLTYTENEWDSFAKDSFDGLGERNTFVPVSFTSAPSASVNGTDSATITFSTSDASTAKLMYGLTSSYTDTISLALATDFTVGVNGLTESTEYHYAVMITRDSDANEATSSDATFTTDAAALQFSAAPSAGSLTDSSAVISFSSNHVSVAAIYYGESSFTDTVNAASATDFSETLSGLTVGTSYIAQVRITKDGDTETVLSDTIAFNTTNIAAIPTVGLFYSEYLEGSSSNKAIEIFNGTGQTIDLADYAFVIYGNGGVSVNNSTVFNSSLLLENDSVYVIANGSANADILARADTTGNITFFNGDDAVAIMKRYNFDNNIEEYIDIIGKIGEDPGSAWEANGVSTANQTLRRMSHITQGITANPASFDPSVDWQSFPIDTYYGLGERTSVVPSEFLTAPTAVANSTDSITISFSFSASNNVNASILIGTDTNYSLDTIEAFGNDFTIGIGGLTEATEYHYMVKTLRDGDNYPANSADDSVTTLSSALIFNAAPLVASITDSTAVIGFETNRLATAAIYYGSSTFTDTVNIAAATDFSEMLSGLAAGTSYMAQVRITKDGDSETVLSDTLNFATTDNSTIALTGIFISEYIEGTSSNKAIELFNGSGQAIDLKDYVFMQFWNGNDESGLNANIFGMDTSYVIADNDVVVMVNSDADSALLAKADIVISGSFNFVSFNGDDALAVVPKYSFAADNYSNLIYVDIFGKIGEDPGSAWTNGDHSSANKTLRRKSSVVTGVSENPTSFDLTLEYDVFNQNTFDGLGERNTVIPVAFSASPDATVNGTDSATITFSASKAATANVMYGLTASYTDTITVASATDFTVGISGLTESTEYHYAVMITADEDATTQTSTDASFTTFANALAFVAAPQMASLTDSSAVIGFTTNYSSTAAIYYGAGALTDTVNVSVAATDFSEALSGLTAETAYIAQVRITKDGDAENVLSDTLNFTTEATPTPFAGGLFISEYIEGSSNNKAVEIYNGTGSTLNLKDYAVVLFSNGSTSPGNSVTFDSDQFLAAGDVFVITNSGANAAIAAQSDITSTLTFFNGDDALAIMTRENYNTSTLEFIDVFGVVGERPSPAWGTGDYTTNEHTLRRKATVLTGTGANPATFDPSVEWDSYPQDNSDDLGQHTVIAAGAFAFSAQPSVSPSFTAANISFATSQNATAVVRYGTSSNYTDSVSVSTAAKNFDVELTGLTSNTTYHFNVSAYEDGDTGMLHSTDATFATFNDAVISIDSLVANFATYNEQTVTTRGVLLNDFGNINTTTAIYIASQTGRAIFISSPTAYNTLLRGDSVQVTGVLSEVNGIYQLVPAVAPTVLNSGNAMPEPISATTAEIASIAYKGDYLRTYAEVTAVSGVLGNGYNITVNDGSGAATVRVWVSTGVDVSGLTVGQNYYFQGAMGAFGGSGQLLPSVQSDIYQGFAFTAAPLAGSISDSSAVIGFETNSNATAVVRYGDGSLTDSIVVTTPTMAFSVPLNGLAENTTYQFNVSVTDTGDVVLTSALASFKTKLPAELGTIFAGMYGDELITALRDSFSMTGRLGYDDARDAMFGTIDNYNDSVLLVYSGQKLAFPAGSGRPNTSTTHVNTEHTWPQSKGADGIRKYDIHHLFPTFEGPNGARSSYRFDEIDDNETTKWWNSNSHVTSIPSTNIDSYSESNGVVFEPREAQKGNTARAMMYFYAMYKSDGINLSWFNSGDHVATLRQWNQLDPVDARELERSGRVKAVQGNDNPFILDPTLVDRIFGETPDFLAFVNEAAVTAADTFATVTWSTNKAASGQLVYGTDTLNLDTLAIATTASGNVRLENLVPETAYMAIVWLTDGNLPVESDTLFFTTLEKDTSTSSGGGGLIISEYVEGSGYNKALEIFNGTGSDIDLNRVKLVKDVNGNDIFSHETIMTGTLKAGETFVVVNSDSRVVPELQALANLLDGGAPNFNGDDQVQLLLDGNIIDHFGNNSGTKFAENVTLRRKPTILNGNLTYSESEWDTYPQDTYSGLGSHVAISGDDFVFVSGPTATAVQFTTASITFATSQNATATVRYGLTNSYTDSMNFSSAKSFSADLTGLTANTDYHYNVTINEVGGQSRTITSNDASFKTLNDATTPISDIVVNFSGYNGQTVTIEGILLNDFGSLQATRTNIYIVAPDGHAINVSSATLYTALKRGDNVRLVGTISEFGGIYQVTPNAEPTVLASGQSIPSPITATTSAINSLTYHGDYVTVFAEVTETFTTSDNGVNITIDDGSGAATVRVWPSTGMDVSGVTVGKSYYFRGATGSYNSTGQLLPSVNEDISDDEVIVVPTDRMAFAHQSFFYNPETSLADDIRFNFAFNRAIVGSPAAVVNSVVQTVEQTQSKSLYFVDYPITETANIQFEITVRDSALVKDTTLVSESIAIAVANGNASSKLDIANGFALQTHLGVTSTFVANKVEAPVLGDGELVSDVMRIRSSNRAARLDVLYDVSSLSYDAKKLSFYRYDLSQNAWTKLPSFVTPDGLKTTLSSAGDVVVMYNNSQTYVPEAFAVSQNFPNPFNPSTTIRVDLNAAQHVRVVIYNSIGQKIRSLANAAFEAGEQEFIWYGKNDLGQQMPSGVYFYTIITNDRQITRKMILMK